MDNTLIFIDAGYISKLSKHFGKGKYLRYDIINFAKNLSKKEKLNCQKIFYYTAPPFQSGKSTKDEEKKKDGYDKFTNKLKRRGVIIREGRCQRLKIDGEFIFKQKAVDSLVIMDLMKIPIDYANIKKVIILACDSDFVPIIEYLKKLKIEVILYTHYSKKRKSNLSRSNALLKSANKYVEIKKQDFDDAQLNKSNSPQIISNDNFNKIITINPASEEVIGEFEKTSTNEIDKIVEKSKIAQKIWQGKTKEFRINVLRNIKKNFEKNQEKLINTINLECGFDKEELKDVFLDVLDGFDYYIKVYESKDDINFPIDEEVFPESTSKIKFYPHGVIVQIGAWNYPLWQTMISAIPALLAGNSIIYKPSEHSIKTGLLTSKIINSSDEIIDDIFISVVGDKEQGKYLVKQDIDAIVYTGNIKTGEEIVANTGIKPVILELSGNDAAIVCSDCDMDQTVNGVVYGAFLHSGEVCDRVKRVYVVKEIAEQFISKVKNKINNIQENVTPLISEDALGKVNEQVLQTVKDGAEVLAGGKIIDRKGFYYEPTLLKLKHNDVESVREEIFGPVVSLLVVENEAEAIKFANSTKFGLGTSIWTQDFEKANDIADKCESGMVWVNDSNIPLCCGEYFKGWKQTSIPNASDRLSLFMKSKTIISFNSNKNRGWWN